MDKNTFLIKYGELGLKGANRASFLEQLKFNILNAIKDKKARIRLPHGRLFLETFLDENIIQEKLSKVFGIVGFAPVKTTTLDYHSIAEQAKTLFLEKHISQEMTFKVLTRRSNKSFPMDSMEINRELGGVLLEQFPNLKVDVHNPMIKLNIEIRENAYLYLDDKPGPGGLPVSTGGKGLLMLSGGIDSPVAGWMLLKRGMKIQPIHFHSPPYTSEKSLDKVKELALKLTEWGLSGPLLVVNFTPIQEQLIKDCDEDYLTILMRRMMIRIINGIAPEKGAQCLITGESLGQVASQTVESLHATGILANLPVFRPLIGFDKDDITHLAKKICSYETSIIPFKDCCQIFVPARPITKPQIEKVEEKEAVINYADLIAQAIQNVDHISL